MRADCAVRSDGGMEYPSELPFDPFEAYPEYEGERCSEEENRLYDSFRSCLCDMRLDETHLGTAKWSPFSDFIVPGNTVVIKPNLVLNTPDPLIQACTTTHPALVRAVVDYVWKALRGRGRIIIGDACSAEADFDEIVTRTGFREMVSILRARGIPVELRDFRAVKVTTQNGIWTGEQKDGNMERGKTVNLGRNSLFYIQREQYRHAVLHGAGYNIAETNRHHRGEVQEYCVSETILHADVVISMPKMKTHRKAGFTCCLKNLVGINIDKNYLPHFSMGSSNMGGDEMPPIAPGNVILMRLYNLVRRHIISHTWQWIGGPAANLLRTVSSKNGRRNQPKGDGICPRGKHENGTGAKDTDADLAKWLHNWLSGQSIAAGAWAGNGTICNMILDLNRIFLCCGKNGELMNQTDRKVFYVVDGVLSGMGNGPVSPSPVWVGAVAAGFNGLSIDVALLNLLGVNENSIPLYQKAKGLPYMQLGRIGPGLYNGKPIEQGDLFGCDLIPPDGWRYEKLDESMRG